MHSGFLLLLMRSLVLQLAFKRVKASFKSIGHGEIVTELLFSMVLAGTKTALKSEGETSIRWTVLEKDESLFQLKVISHHIRTGKIA